MLICLFIYTRDVQFAEKKANEVLSLLNISDIISIQFEPYWKYDDVTVTGIETTGVSFPEQKLLNTIAKQWLKLGDDCILTSDTAPDNEFYISDIEMITMDLY